MDTPDVMAARAALDAAPAVVAAVEAELAKTAPASSPAWKRHLVSIVDHSVSVFSFTFLGLVTATNLSDPTALKAAGIAGGIAVGAYLKAVAATYLAKNGE